MLLSYFIFRNDRSRIRSTINALNTDDVAGIRSGFDIDWTPERIQDFQTAMNTGPFENEFCSDDRVSYIICITVAMCITSLLHTEFFGSEYSG